MGQTCRVIRYVSQASVPFWKPEKMPSLSSPVIPGVVHGEQVRVHHYSVWGGQF